MHMVFTKSLLARAFFTRSVKVIGWQPGAPKSPGARLQKKRPVFEIHRTSDASMGSVALSNQANGLYGTLTSQSSVYNVN